MPHRPPEIIPTYWTVVGTGDFNGDNRDDIIWRRDDGAFTEWLGQADGGFVSNDIHAWQIISTNWRVITTGDYNGDNRDDVLWRRDDGAVTNWLGQADGGFATTNTPSILSRPTGSSSRTPAAPETGLLIAHDHEMIGK